MKLLLADDHTLFRDALVQFIERAEPEAVITLAKDLHEVMLRLQENDNIDMILLDLRMPGMNGLQGLEKIVASYPEIPVALLSGLAEKEDVDHALEIGAAGYFPKTLSGKAMLKGIHDIIDGKQYIAYDHNTNEIMPSHYHGIQNNITRPVPQNNAAPSSGLRGSAEDIGTLTPRETEVLSYLMSGQSNKDIARALDLQVVTIKLHVRGICRKLGAKNRTQAALIAQEQGLISQY